MDDSKEFINDNIIENRGDWEDGWPGIRAASQRACGYDLR